MNIPKLHTHPSNPPRRSLKGGLFSAASLAVVGFSVFVAPSKSNAVVSLTYDLRVSALNGIQVPDSKFAVGVPGDVVTVKLIAIVLNANNNQTNDGFLGAAGSFVSTGMGGAGTWSAFGSALTENGVDFRGVGSQSGLLATAPDTTLGGADVGLVGGAADTGVPAPNPYFAANTNSLSVLLGTDAASSSNLEFLLGTKTFTITALGTVQLSFVGRSTSALSKPNKWTTDGVALTKNGNDAAFIGYGLPVLINVPEPTAFGMVVLGALGLVGFRRAGVRRF